MKIAVIGANGQVGREVCLFLSVMGIQVLAISRSEIGGAFLERCGVTCAYGSVGKPEEARSMLAGCDLVADFSHPRSGLVGEIRSAIRSNIESVLQWAPPNAPYVYISTINAFGMRDGNSELKNYWLSHSRYSANKRYGEKLAFRGKTSRSVYILRLGHVHGELQKVSAETIEEVSSGRGVFPFDPNTESYTVFCFSIAEALKNIGAGRESPGRYTLVSTPGWSWKDLYSYWADRVNCQFEFVVRQRSTSSNVRLRWFGKKCSAPLVQWSMRNRELILNYFLGHFPTIEARISAEYLRRKAASEISAYARDAEPAREFMMGQIPGRRLTSLSDSRVSMGSTAGLVRNLIDKATFGITVKKKVGVDVG